MTYVVDAHTLIWYVEDHPKLGRAARSALLEPTAKIVVLIIAVAEILWMIENRKTNIPSAADLLANLDADPRIRIAELDRAIVEASISLRAVGEMHDRQIVATAAHLIASGQPATVLTRDADITASGLVPVLW